MSKLIIVRSGEYNALVRDFTKESKDRAFGLTERLRGLAGETAPDILCPSGTDAAGLMLGILRKAFRAARYAKVPKKEIPLEDLVAFIPTLFADASPAAFVVVIADGEYPADFAVRYARSVLGIEISPLTMGYAQAIVFDCEARKAEWIS